MPRLKKTDPLPRNRGFTLIEMIVVMSIISIVIAIAVPSFKRFIESGQLTATANDFVGSLNLARSEAITRGVTVTVCKSADQADCVTTGNWEQGWIVFTDPNNDGAVTNAATDILLRVHEPLAGSATLVGNANTVNRISYAPTGFPAVPSNGTVTLTIGSRTVNVEISSTGRVRTER